MSEMFRAPANPEWTKYWIGKTVNDGAAGMGVAGLLAVWWCDRYGHVVLDRYDRAYCPHCGFALDAYHDKSSVVDFFERMEALRDRT